ncbi:MAG: hypothetical protein ACE5IO_04365 [Thermoplasmata archaeon]
MPTLLIHSLVAAAVQSLVNLGMMGQGINEFTFYAAISSILVDLDHRSDGKRSSAVHSLFSVPLALALGFIILSVANDIWIKLLAFSVTVGFASHVLIDASDRGGIFLVPLKSDVIALFRRSGKSSGQGSRTLHMILTVLSVSTLLILVVL